MQQRSGLTMCSLLSAQHTWSEFCHPVREPHEMRLMGLLQKPTNRYTMMKRVCGQAPRYAQSREQVEIS
jgi:hypothetical protein